MSGPVDFILRLRDMVSAPAGKAAASLSSVQKSLRSVDKSAKRARVAPKTGGAMRAMSDLVVHSAKAAKGVVSTGAHAAKSAIKTADHVGRSAARSVDWVGKSASRTGAAMSGLAAGAGAAVAAMAVTGVVQFGSGLAKAASFKEDMQLALKTILGTDAAAADAIGRARKVADQVGQNPMDAIESFRELLSKGFKIDQVERLTKTFADLKVISPQMDQGRVFGLLAKIKATGRLQGDELVHLSDAGLDTARVYAELSKMLGKPVDQLQKLQAAGKITADDAIEAATRAASAISGGGAAGALAGKRAATTVSGLLDTIKGRAVGLVLDLEVPGGDGVKGILGSVASLLDGSTDSGKRLRTVLGSVVGALGGLVGQVLGAGGGALMDGLLSALEMVAGLITEIAPAVGAFARGWIEGMGTASGAVVEIFGALTALAKVLSENAAAIQMVARVIAGVMVVGLRLAGAAAAAFSASIGVISSAASAMGSVIIWAGGVVLGLVETLVSAGSAIVSGIVTSFYGAVGAIGSFAAAAYQLGADIINGIVEGITSGASKVADAVSSAAGGAIDSAKAVLGISSPSREFRWIGEMSAEGWALGLGASDGPARAAGVAAGGSLGAAAGGGGAGGGSVVIEAGAVVIHASGGEDVRRAAEEAAMLLLERISMQVGARAA